MVDWTSLAIPVAASAPAYAFAALTWMESRKQNDLLKTMVESLPLITRKPKRRTIRRRPPAPAGTVGLVTVPAPGQLSHTQRLKEEAGARASLRLKLQQEKEQWHRQKDVAKAIGWIIDRMDSRDYEDEDDDGG